MRYFFIAALLLAADVVNAQSIAIKDMMFGSGYHYHASEDGEFKFIYRVNNRDKTKSTFRKIDFDHRLDISDTSTMVFGGNYSLIASTFSPNYTACLFASKANRNVIIHFQGENDYARSVILKTKAPWTKKMKVQVYHSNDNDKFYFMYAYSPANWEIQSFSVQGQLLWTTQIASNKGKLALTQPQIFDGDLLLIASENMGKKNGSNDLVLVDHETGTIRARKALNSSQQNIAIDNVFFVDSALYVAGRKFYKRKLNHELTGMPYFSFFKRGMEAPEEIQLNNSLQAMKFFWMDMIKDEKGNYYLVGETFKTESQGSYYAKMFATGILTLGMVMVTWQSMHLNDILILPLEDAALPPQIIRLEPKRVQVGIYQPSYQFISYAYKTGQVRYFGHSATGDSYVADGDELKKINLGDYSVSNLGPIPKGSSQAVAFTSDNYIMVVNQSKAYNLVEFRIVPLL